jgi:hypothetical protein
VLFVAMVYVPSFLQTVQHKSAFEAGLHVIPLLVGLVAAIAFAGTGRYKIYPVIGAILTGVSMGSLGFLTASSTPLVIIAAMIFAGAGVGLNAIEYRHLGIATGALNFFKSIGGAFGAALFGAILAVIMHEKPLSEEMIEVAEGKVEVPEY